MAAATQRQIRHSNAPIKKKVKMGGVTVVSRALVKPSATNLIPKLHIKRGDMVMMISGSKEAGRGKTGKVLNVFPQEGKIVVEGLNMITRHAKARSMGTKSGIVKKEGKIAASKVMLYCTACNKPTRVGHKVLDGGKKTRLCKQCNEAFDA